MEDFKKLYVQSMEKIDEMQSVIKEDMKHLADFGKILNITKNNIQNQFNEMSKQIEASKKQNNDLDGVLIDYKTFSRIFNVLSIAQNQCSMIDDTLLEDLNKIGQEHIKNKPNKIEHSCNCNDCKDDCKTTDKQSKKIDLDKIAEQLQKAFAVDDKNKEQQQPQQYDPITQLFKMFGYDIK